MATTKKSAAKKTTAAKKTSVARKTTAVKKSTAAKTTATKSTAAKTTATKSTAAKRSAAAKQAAATEQTNAVRESIASVTKGADDTFKQYTAVAGEQLVELRQLVRDVVDIYVGVPFVLGTRVADSATTPNVDLDALKSFLDDVRARLAEMPSVDFDAVKAFLDEAKTVGHAQVAAFESQVGVAADTVGKRFDAATAKLGAQLPAQVVEVFESGRARLRSLYAAA